jgi:hypothetical protein
MQQKPFIERKGIGGEGSHHLIASGESVFELLHLQPPQTIFPIRFGLG